MTGQDNEAHINTETAADDYDSPWKTAVEQYFPEFMAFYFPDAQVKIDWAKGYVFLDQELQSLTRDAELGRRLLDKLVQITLLSGAEEWIYIHIEVQGAQQAEFGERMFVYNYRIYDRYRRPVASMAVLADAHAAWRPDHFSYSVLGSETSIRFPVAKLTDYRDRLDELEVSENAFALITAAHILTRQTRKNDQARKDAKSQLVRLLYHRKWDKQRVIDLFTVLDWMMKLPEELEQQLWHEIEAIEEKEKMRYVTSVERIGIAKGLQVGLQQGREEGRQEGRREGRQEGRQEGETRLLKKQLERRFGALPVWAIERLNHANEQDLDRWGDAVLTQSTLEAIFAPEADDSAPH